MIGISIVLIFSIIIYFLILPYIGKEKFEERQGKLRAVVNTVVSMMDTYERSLRRQAWRTDPSMPRTVEEAKRMIIKSLREMRYDKTEYFFILDGNGYMVMHPLKQELEGTNMLDVTDHEGVHVFSEMVTNSQTVGETFVSYEWQSKYSPVIFEPQTTYAKYYWPWDWVICSSLYTQDIKDSMKSIILRSTVYDAATACATMAFLFFFVYITFSRPLRKLLNGILEIHNGNLDHRINISSLDEIGYISQEFNSMVSNLKDSRDHIVKSEAKYRELADMLPDIIYETDMDFNIRYLNEAGHVLTGYTPEDILSGLSLKDLIGGDDFQIISGIVQNSNSRKFLITHKILKKQDGYFYGENNGIVLSESENPGGLRGSIRDVTEKLKMEEKIIQTQKMDTIGTLAAGLAHDFNNVLAGITSTLSIVKYEMLKGERLSGEKLEKHLDIMEQSGKRAIDMVQQLLTLSQKRDTQFEPVDLSHLINNTIKICHNTFDKCINIKSELPPGTAMINGDPTQIEQIILNLCVNSNHAMTIMRNSNEHHGGTLIVSLEKIHADEHFRITHPESKDIDYWKLSVKDTGVGIDKNSLAKIFDPFFTTKEKGRGTGLGLTMVYSIVQQHKGFVDIYSNIGIGTTFNAYLPVLNRDVSQAYKEQDIRIPMGEGLILVIDDEEVLRYTARLILEKCGYQVITAENGEEGVRIFKERHRDIKAVLIDLVMPKKSGEQAYLEMKEIRPDIKVLLASGFKQDERVNMALSYGIKGFIQKPFTLGKLARAMADLLNDPCVDEKGEQP